MSQTTTQPNTWSMEDFEQIMRRVVREEVQTGPALPTLLTIDDVADTLKVSPRTLDRMLKDDEFPRPLRIGSQRRWAPGALEAYLKRLANES